MNLVKIRRKISSPTLRISELMNFIGKDVEITITETNKISSIERSAAGFLEQFKDHTRVVNEKQAWIEAIKQKHGNKYENNPHV